jgi:hypothetical protein
MIGQMRAQRFRRSAGADGGPSRGAPTQDRRRRGFRRFASRCLAPGCALLAFAAAGETQALRCGSKLISPGDPAAKLRQFCGEPESVYSRLEQRGLFVHGRYFPGFVQEIVVEDWTYNFGPNKLMRVVRVEDGIVREIELLGYGYYDASP